MGPPEAIVRRVLPVGVTLPFPLSPPKRPQSCSTHSFTVRRQFLSTRRFCVKPLSMCRKKPSPRKTKTVSGSYRPLLLELLFTMRRKALSQADLLPPSPLRPLYGYRPDFSVATGKTITCLLGLYKAAFTAGVCGIFYSAYSLVKVGDLSAMASLHVVEDNYH